MFGDYTPCFKNILTKWVFKEEDTKMSTSEIKNISYTKSASKKPSSYTCTKADILLVDDSLSIMVNVEGSKKNLLCLHPLILSSYLQHEAEDKNPPPRCCSPTCPKDQAKVVDGSSTKPGLKKSHNENSKSTL